MKDFSPWPQFTHRMMTTQPFLRVSLATVYCDDVTLGGDFNLVLNIEKDNKGGLPKTHTKAVNAINGLGAKFNFFDK